MNSTPLTPLPLDDTPVRSAPLTVAEALDHPDPRHAEMMIGEVLVDMGYATESDVTGAVRIGRETKRLLGQVLLGFGTITGRQLAKAMAARCGLPFIDYDVFPLDDNVLLQADTTVARDLFAIPCAMLGDKMVIAVSDATNVVEAEAFGTLLGVQTICVVAQENDVYFMIKRAEELREARAATEAAPAAPPAESGEPARLRAVA